MAKRAPGDTDVLVIGGGVAACMAAIEAAKYGVHVTLVDKGLMGRSGSSPTADCALSAAFGHASLEGEAGRDSEEQHYLDTLRRGEWLSDPRLAAVMAHEAKKLALELETFGVQFSKTPEGLFFQYRTLGHTYARCCSPVGGGLKFMEALRKETLHRRVQVAENVMVTRLLQRDGEVVGAYALDIEDGEEHVFRCKAAVVAAGSATRLYRYTSASYHTTGDAFVLGYEAGATLANMEFPEFTVIPKVGLKLISSSGITPFMGRGSRLFNARGERFLKRWDPEQLERTTRAILTRAIYKEMVEGRGPVYNDASAFTEDVWKEFEYSQGSVLHKLRAAGIDPRKDRFEWTPAVHTFLGGILIDERGETGVPGLFAAGECSASIHGANRLSDNATSECLVFGKRAGRFAAALAREGGEVKVPEEAVAAERERLKALWQERGEDPRKVEKEVRETAWRGVGVVRAEATLREALARFRELGARPLRVKDLPDLLLALEVRNMVWVGEMVAAAALERRESRGQHYRGDCPEKRDEWRRWIAFRRGPEGPLCEVVPVPETREFEALVADCR